jgi:hypothetical protein
MNSASYDVSVGELETRELDGKLNYQPALFFCNYFPDRVNRGAQHACNYTPESASVEQNKHLIAKQE